MSSHTSLPSYTHHYSPDYNGGFVTGTVAATSPLALLPTHQIPGACAIKALCFQGQMGPLLFHKLVPAYESCEGAGVFSFAICLMNVH